MAIVKMQYVTLAGMLEDRDKVLSYLQKCGVMEIIKTREAYGDKKDNMPQIKAVKKAIDIIDKYSPKKREFFSDKKITDISKYSMDSLKIKELEEHIKKLTMLEERILENKENISRLKQRINSLGTFYELDIPMKYSGSENTEAVNIILSGEWNDERVRKSLEGFEYIHYEILESTKLYCALWITVHKKESDKLRIWIKQNHAQTPDFPLSKKTPKDKAHSLAVSINEFEKLNREFEKKISQYRKYKEDFKLLYDVLMIQSDKQEISLHTQKTHKTFIIEGWVAKSECEKLFRDLNSSFLIYISSREPKKKEEVPVKFANSKIFAPVEGVTKTYAMPSRHDIDPNPIMAVFYYIFFGMMFSDAGYGLVMVIACYFLGYRKRDGKGLFKMMFWCGISTVFWGFMYGSFFGDAIDKIAHTFFNVPQTVRIIEPLWIDPQKDALLLLIVSIAFGIVQILVGLGIRFYMNMRIGKWQDAVYDVGSWMLIISGTAISFLGAFYLKALGPIGAIMIILGILGIVIMGGREKKGIRRALKGVAGLYDVTSYVSDALSYSRLMALGLATGVIAQVVNILGTLGGTGLLGTVMFIAIFIAGHSINFALNVLGAYVHTNRLQYVEFYSKFYEGGGRAFEPFEIDAKYHSFLDLKERKEI